MKAECHFILENEWKHMNIRKEITHFQTHGNQSHYEKRKMQKKRVRFTYDDDKNMK